MAAFAEAPMKEGYLYKKGLYRTQAWKKRWFYFDPKVPGKLFYHRDQKKDRKLFKVFKVPEKMKEKVWEGKTKEIDVMAVRSIASETFDELPESVQRNGIAVNILDEKGGNKKVMLYAETAEEKRRWLETLQSWKRETDKKSRAAGADGMGYSSTYIS